MEAGSAEASTNFHPITTSLAPAIPVAHVLPAARFRLRQRAGDG